MLKNKILLIILSFFIVLTLNFVSAYSAANYNNTVSTFPNGYSANNYNNTILTFQEDNSDLISPNATLLYPLNNTFNSTNNQNFTFNATDNSGIQKVNLTIYNQTGYYNSTLFNFAAGVVDTVRGVVNYLIDGVYKWWVTVWDFAGNTFITGNNTITIDSINPKINLTFPTNTTYNINISALNYTGSDTNLQSCWYSIDNGATNTSVNCVTNLTGLISNEGSNTWLVGANDSANNKNMSKVTFFKDTIYPLWGNNKTDLTSSTILGSNVYFNITLSETNPSAYIFSWYNGTNWENTTGNYTNGQEISINKTINIDIGIINWTWYINDTLNNINQTDVWSINLLEDAQSVSEEPSSSILTGAATSGIPSTFNITSNYTNKTQLDYNLSISEKEPSSIFRGYDYIISHFYILITIGLGIAILIGLLAVYLVNRKKFSK
jgi:hypothetical protein